MEKKLKLIIEVDAKVISKFAFLKGVPQSVTVGRKGNSVDVPVPDELVSAQHLQMIWDGEALYVCDLNSTNGTYVNRRKISPSETVRVSVGDAINLSNSGKVKINVVAPDSISAPSSGSNKKGSGLLDTDVVSLLKQKDRVIIGRSQECDIVLDHPTISRRHAVIENSGNSQYKIKDLGSVNGIYVNGKKVSSAVIREGDRVMVGRFEIPLRGAVRNISQNSAVQTFDISKVYDNGHVGLHPISISIPSNSLLAIMGPSGCGKSTLLKALNGENPPSNGSVRIFDLDLIENFEYLKTQIGYVPQDDIIHKELTVRECIYYAAKLRLENASEEFIDQKINQLLQELNIAHVVNNRVSNISGGQRKRVSIAVELLTDPGILFLDEPTSPLDPQTIKEFLDILRRLSEKGTTVIMVTHKPEDLHYMDSVIFMAEGGHMVYYSSSSEFKNYFGVDSAVQVYEQISGTVSKRWVEKFRATNPSSSHPKSASSVRKSSYSNPFYQFYWLTRRYLNIKTNDRGNTAIMILQAPVIAALICLIFDYVFSAVPFLMVISALWFGANNASREIVSELPIYKRERMFNVMIIPYIFSKLTVLSIFGFIQSALFILIIAFFYSADSNLVHWNNIPYSVLWMFLITVSASLMGLMISALLDNTEKVMSVVPLLLIPQIMLAGIVAKISSKLVEYISYLTLSRWGTEGMNIIQKDVVIERAIPVVGENGMNSVNSSEMVKSDGVEFLHHQFHSEYNKTFGDFAGTMKLDFIAVSILSFIFFIVIYASLRHKDSIKREIVIN